MNIVSYLEIAEDRADPVIVKKIISKLVKTKQNVNSCPDDGYLISPLYKASEWNHATIVEMLVQNGADVNCKTYTGATPLHMSCAGGNEMVSEYLINHGADVNAKELSCDDTPLFYAVNSKKIVLVDLLLKRGANLEHKNLEGETAIFTAIRSRDVGMVKFLLDHGAKKDVTDNHGNTLPKVAGRPEDKVFDDMVKLWS